MKKIFLLLLLIPFFTLNALSEIIKDIEVNGNDRITKETIVVFGGITLDKEYDSKKLNKVLLNLYETSFFSDVDLNLSEGLLTINVVENPIIQNIIIKGLKADKFQKQVTEIIELKEKTSFNDVAFESDINKIKSAFKGSGFYFVEVNAFKKEKKNNSIDLIYEIKLNEKAKIAKIQFIGNKIFKDGKLRDIITSEETRPWKVISSKKFLSESRINLDQRLLTNFYKNKGYYEIMINATNVNYLEDRGFLLTYNIEAGKKYKFNKLKLNIADDFQPNDFLKVEKQLSKLKNKYYSSTKINKILKEIDKISVDKDYQFLASELSETISGEFIDVDININQTEKLYVERINIMGNSVTNDNVIRGELLLDEGDPFNKLILSKSINALKSRNLFAKISEEIKKGSSSDLKIIDINVEEKATGEIALGAGIGTGGGTLAFTVIENNYMGKGIRLDTNMTISQDSIRGKFAVVNPNFRYSGNSLNTSFESTQVDKSKESGYQTTKTGFTIGTGFEQYEDIFIFPEISSMVESVKTDTKASKSMKNQAGDFWDTYLKYSIVKDKRDQTFATTDGYRFSFLQEIPVAANKPSIVNGFDFAKYHSFSEKAIAKINLYGRAVNAFSDQNVRVSRRIILPQRQLRGFEAGKIGPKDGDDFVGGNYASAFSLSTTFPKLLPNVQNADFSLFFDAANVWGLDYDKQAQSSNTIRSAVGIAANWHTIVGPLSFSLSQSLSKANTDITEVFRFNLGTSF